MNRFSIDNLICSFSLFLLSTERIDFSLVEHQEEFLFVPNDERASERASERTISSVNRPKE